MRTDKGFSIIALLVAIFIIVAIIGTIAYLVTNKVENVQNVEVEYSKTEVAEALVKKVNAKILDASKEIQNTKSDLSSSFNENNLITYLDNPTDLAENPGLDCIDPYEQSSKVQNAKEDGEVYTIYIIKPETLLDKSIEYGKGNFETGDVFTLEPITQDKEDGTKKSTGSYEIKYYDNDKNSTVIEKMDLYLTNQS